MDEYENREERRLLRVEWEQVLDHKRTVGRFDFGVRVCELAYDYVHTFQQFGNLIGQFQMMQSMMADMHTEMMFCQTTLYTTACNMDKYLAEKGSGLAKKGLSEFTVKCAAVILRLTEAASFVGDQTLKILGRNGYIGNYEVSRLERCSIEQNRSWHKRNPTLAHQSLS